VVLGAAALLAIALGLGLRARHSAPAAIPVAGDADLGPRLAPDGSPSAERAPADLAERARLLAALEALPQAEAAWRGVPSEDYLAILSAVDASLCATAAGSVEPTFPVDAADRLERRRLTPEARAVARYLLTIGALPDRVGLSLRVFLRGRPAFSPGPSGWSVAGLATLLFPDEARYFTDLVRQNGALRRWRDTPPVAATAPRFATVCDRRTVVGELGRRSAGPLAEALRRYLAATPVDLPLDDHGLRYAVVGAERDEAAATLEVRLRVTNPGADERPLALDRLRLFGLDGAPTVDPPAPRLGAGLVRELRLTFTGVTDVVAEATVLVVGPGAELDAYSEDLR
jgi:hypothetical protein